MARGQGTRATRSASSLWGTSRGETSFVRSAIRLQKCKEITRTQFRRLPHALFRQLTGFRFRVAWAPARYRRSSDHDRARRISIKAPGSSARKDALRYCRICSMTHRDIALNSSRESRCVRCPLGGNSWIPIMVASFTVGIAFMERLPVRQESDPKSRGTSKRASARVSAPSTGSHAKGQKKRDRLSRTQFAIAVRVLRLFVRYLGTASFLKVTEGELVHARQQALTLGREKTRLGRRLSRVFPSLYQTSTVTKHESRAEQFVQRTLDLIHQNYAKPITLKQCADQLALHPAYLCRLFSQIVGLPFKTYLTDLRFEKARQLLSDPARRVSEVAYAVGYSDANRFRAAFKKATGLSPFAWREACRASTRP